MRLHAFGIAVLTLAACGGAERAPTTATVALPTNAVVLGISRRVAMLDVTLTPGETFEAPPSSCQDTMVLVRSGEIRLAPEGDQEAILGPAGSMRLGRIRPSMARTIDAPAELLVVIARPDDTPFDEARGLAGIYDPPSRCGGGTAEQFVLGYGPEPFEHEEGRLKVSIFLDARATGTALAGLSLLEGTPDLPVRRHAHELSDEILFIESGEGTMTRGDERIPVRGPQFVWVPAGMPHGLDRSGDAPLRAYQVYAPAGPEQRFRIPSR